MLGVWFALQKNMDFFGRNQGGQVPPSPTPPLAPPLAPLPALWPKWSFSLLLVSSFQLWKGNIYVVVVHAFKFLNGQEELIRQNSRLPKFFIKVSKCQCSVHLALERKHICGCSSCLQILEQTGGTHSTKQQTPKNFYQGFKMSMQCAFGIGLKSQLFLLFSLFLLLFMSLIILFGTIHKSYCTISATFQLYLQYFQ